MKTLPFLAVLGLCYVATAQVPNAINFQAVARDAAGSLMVNQPVSLTFTLHSGAADGPVVYLEDHDNITTNALGLFSVSIGAGTHRGVSLAEVDWSDGALWLETRLNGVSIGAQKLLAVPYAFLAQDVVNDAVEDSDADPTNELQELSINGNELTISGGNTITLPLDVHTEDGNGHNTLDKAYDQGGPGAGRSITADAGAVHIKGNGGLVVDGNVGIGTASPSAALDIVGSLQLADGTEGSGKVLTSDGTGNATWSAVADPSATNELQALSLAGNDLTISGGNTVTLPSGGGTLDDAYDSGGAGAGRAIDAVDGAVSVQGEDGFEVTGSYGYGAGIGSPGAGTRMIFNPNKAAFRAGEASGSEWDEANVGDHSVAMGSGNTASEESSIALGLGNTSSGLASTALGWGNTSSGMSSTALGGFNTSSGAFSTALGLGAVASGGPSIALGFPSEASGDYSIALGTNVSTDGFSGAVIIGDRSQVNVSLQAKSSAANQFTARFAGGYRLFTDNITTTGVSLAAGGNAWVVISDANRKENFLSVDAEEILSKIGTMNLTSWNYKNQDSATQRHYGPMAQDFFAAFGSDAFGTIGNDSTINQADFDGINLIGIQGLEHRTSDLKAIVDQLSAQNDQLRHEVELLKGMVQTQQTELSSIKRSVGLTVDRE